MSNEVIALMDVPEPIQTKQDMIVAEVGGDEAAQYMLADEEFLEALREYRVISNQEKVLKAKKDVIKNKIAKTMGPKFYAVDEDGLVVCTYKEDSPRIKFDEGTFEHDYPQLYLQYLVEDKKIIRSLRPKL